VTGVVVVAGHHKAVHTVVDSVPPPGSEPAASEGTDDSDKIEVVVLDI